MKILDTKQLNRDPMCWGFYLGRDEDGKLCFCLENGVVIKTLQNPPPNSSNKHLSSEIDKCSQLRQHIQEADRHLNGVSIGFAPVDEGKKDVLKQEKASAEKAYLNAKMAYIIEAAAIDTEICKHIPVAYFKEFPTLGEEILTKYQELKLAELQKMSPSQDFTAFVDDIQKNVDDMNKTFDKAEKMVALSQEMQGKTSTLFERKKEL